MNSDSSDEENIELLKEAQDKVFLSESLFTNPTAHFESAETTQKGNIPSLRKTKEEDSQFNVLGVTPEFQKYIAKHLSAILDEKLVKMTKSACSDEDIFKRHGESAIKLFTSSESFLEITDSQANANIYSNRKAKKTTEKIYVNKEELKNVVVSGEEILGKKDIKYWSTRTKGKIFHYLKDDKGQLVLKE